MSPKQTHVVERVPKHQIQPPLVPCGVFCICFLPLPHDNFSTETMISQRSLLALLVALVALISSTQAFCTPPNIPAKNKFALIRTCSSTQLAERRWNFNEGRSPWGLKTNAEIWNGRVAQVMTWCCGYDYQWVPFLLITSLRLYSI